MEKSNITVGLLGTTMQGIIQQEQSGDNALNVEDEDFSCSRRTLLIFYHESRWLMWLPDALYETGEALSHTERKMGWKKFWI
mmetsp:Transcript_25251/g.47932  ORF Transcript_25251/g.47932 Transcript_25251/m.47932 type:complete len:82 (+) Transcript_25251:514-759(+)